MTAILPARALDVPAALSTLRDREVNYDLAEVAEPAWRFDEHRHGLGVEPPGPPVPDGVWERARLVVRDYNFTPPGLIRAWYRGADPLPGRNMLLEGRFGPLRFLLGVRVTDVVAEEDGGQRCWGWSYVTLRGHIERGRVDYAVVKDLDTGLVFFRVRSHNQLNPSAHPVVRLGWALFGRGLQLRFYRHCAQRLRALTHAGPPVAAPLDEVVRVPLGVRPGRWDRWSVVVADAADQERTTRP
ncbi:DUF1990 family protein [Crossiella sp. CA-258035]|uniref:DUF1990 family protein n=1 Tax=Crossiella sp. CA-258035 TaxID=2981138 RepID=UPI0024BC551F|nr:DUF1990 family protein [Crossiella sp. CA-258035]WHT22947.1 DUF1990 family protein [Crossiella sp. CA-258035]